jgi:hypothetical protein
MKAFLTDADRDFDTDADLPVNAGNLTADLGLDILLDAMAAGDTFLRKAAEHGCTPAWTVPPPSSTGSTCSPIAWPGPPPSGSCTTSRSRR